MAKTTLNLVTGSAVHHINIMSLYNKSWVQRETGGPTKPERTREAVLENVAEAKHRRDRDASQAMKDHEANRLAILAKTARLRTERLARIAEATPPPNKTKRRKKT